MPIPDLLENTALFQALLRGANTPKVNVFNVRKLG
jgi:hypothetical protein